MRHQTGVLLGILAAILWSFQGTILSFMQQADTWAILFWRSSALATVIFAYIFVRDGHVNPRMALKYSTLIGAAAFVPASLGAIYAFQTIPVAMAVLLFATSPFFAAFLGLIVLKEPVSKTTWAAIFLAACAIFILIKGPALIANYMAQGNEGQLSMADLITHSGGYLAALLSGLGFAVFTVTLRYEKQTDAMPILFCGGLLCVLIAALVALLAPQGGFSPLHISLFDLGFSLFMGAITLAGGMILYTIGTRVMPATEATLLSLGETFLAPIWALWIAHQPITQNIIWGGILLIAAIYINTYSKRPEYIAA